MAAPPGFPIVPPVSTAPLRYAVLRCATAFGDTYGPAGVRRSSLARARFALIFSWEVRHVVLVLVSAHRRCVRGAGVGLGLGVRVVAAVAGRSRCAGCGRVVARVVAAVAVGRAARVVAVASLGAVASLPLGVGSLAAPPLVTGPLFHSRRRVARSRARLL